MNISLNWLQNYLSCKKKPRAIAEILTQIGLEVTQVAPFAFVPPELVLGQVRTCVPHPHADRLQVTTVDIGQGDPLSIVCGAPNVEVGQKVIVAPVGTTLRASDGRVQTISCIRIRGVQSAGMLCAAAEIGLSAHQQPGIMVLDTPLPPGTPAATCLSTPQDTVLAIDLTPNRADAYGHLGVARDLGAALDQPVQWPALAELPKNKKAALPLQVVVADTTTCPRYAALVLQDITIQPSPPWLQSRLRAIGVAAVNNVVDVTHFVLHELGQPLHAFDYDQLDQQQLQVRTMPQGTPFTALDGVERSLEGHELMVCDGTGPVCMAGVIGSMRARVTQNTRRLVLESAYYAPETITRTTKHHGLHTAAAFRFERGADPELVPKALQRAYGLLKDLAHATLAASPVDQYPHKILATKVPVSYRKVAQIMGKTLPKATLHRILKRLEIVIQNPTPTGFTAIVPPYRVDVRREVDIIEELLRVYGYDRIAVTGQLGTSYLASADHHPVRQTYKIACRLAAQGLYEIKTNPLTTLAYAADHHPVNKDTVVHLCHASSQRLNSLRQTLLFSGLEVLAHNIRHGQSDLKLFELGKCYQKQDTAYAEDAQLGLWFTGHQQAPHWSRPLQAVTFQDLYAVVHSMLCWCNLKGVEATMASHGLYEACLRLSYKGEILGHVGSVKTELLRQMDIQQAVFFAELAVDQLCQQPPQPPYYQPVSKFPAVRRDLSLILDQRITFTQIQQLVQQCSIRNLQEMHVVDYYQGQQLPQGKKAYSLRLVLQAPDKTLTEPDIEQVMQRLMQACETQLGAYIRQ